MKKYLSKNYIFWQKGYNAPNVESHIFRLAGRILKPQFNLPNKSETLLDFGCGQGANVNYFHQLGFKAWGIDISKKDIEIAKKRYPHIKKNFSVCKPEVYLDKLTSFTNSKKINVIICSQSLYYFEKKHFYLLLKKMHDSLVNGGLIFATMMSTKHTYYKFSKKTKDEWLRVTNFNGKRFKIKDYYNFHTKNIKDLKSKFKYFKPVHCGSYFMQLEHDETNNFHYTFLGKKT